MELGVVATIAVPVEAVLAVTAVVIGVPFSLEKERTNLNELALSLSLEPESREMLNRALILAQSYNFYAQLQDHMQRYEK